MISTMTSPALDLAIEEKPEQLTAEADFTIVTQSEFDHPSAMPAHLRAEKQLNSPELSEMFEKSVNENKQIAASSVNWLDDQTVQLNGVSGTALHKFILEAEKLGMNVSYTKQTIIKISK